jgi:hypothetical protein
MRELTLFAAGYKPEFKIVSQFFGTEAPVRMDFQRDNERFLGSWWSIHTDIAFCYQGKQ